MKAIIYHYVQKENTEFPYLNFLHHEDFVKQLDYFTRIYGVLLPSEFAKNVKSGSISDNRVIFTFDDGLKCHFTYVFNELLKRKISAFFYINTGIYQSKKLSGVHRVHVLLGKFSGKRIYESLSEIISEEMFDDGNDAFSSSTYKNQDNDWYTLQVKRMLNYFIAYQYRDKILDDLMSLYIPGEEQLTEQFYLSENEIKQMHDAGMIIGSHSANHLLMSRLSLQEQEKEIRDSFLFLEKITGGLPYKTFCYPYGGNHSFAKSTVDLLNKENCRFTFGAETRNITSEDLILNVQNLPRYDCNQFPFGNVRKYDKALSSL